MSSGGQGLAVVLATPGTGQVMSLNVSPLSPYVTGLLLAGGLALGLGFVSMSPHDGPWSVASAAAPSGVCAQACEVAACLSFMGSSAESSRQCHAQADSHWSDLRRAGPDPACVTRCEHDGLPVELKPVTPAE
jgi:hypothetical protein